jgi:signal transduction histidine kinase
VTPVAVARGCRLCTVRCNSVSNVPWGRYPAPLMDDSRHAWKAIVRELYRVFQKADEERELLRDIDRSIIDAREDGAKRVEDVFCDSLVEISRIHDLRDRGSCYVYVGPKMLLLESELWSFNGPTRLDTSEAIRALASKRNQTAQILSKNEAPDGLFDQLTDANTILIHPIYTELGDLICVLLFADVHPSAGSRLADPDLCDSLRTMAQQLHIAYEHRVRADQEVRTEELWELFLSSHLAPIRCFHDLAHKVRTAFPTFGPLRLARMPEVQILVAPDADNSQFLTIRGTTGSEPAITKIDVSDSIVGLLIENSKQELPYFYDDPRKEEYEGRYKSYLGLDEPNRIRTEFAVRLCLPDGRLVGILNVESGATDAFNLHHRNALLQFATRIAPMVDVFEQRLMQNRIMHRSVISTTSNYLESLAGTFRHGIGTPLLALHLNVIAGRRIIDESVRPELSAFAGNVGGTDRLVAMDQELERVGTVLSKLLTVEAQIGGFAEDFATDISGFSDSGRFDVRQLIDETVGLVRRSMLKDEEYIRIEVHGADHADAFCSLLLKQHLYSLFTNAIYSLQSRPRGPASIGTIDVTVERHSPSDESQELDLNKRWAIVVRDNGDGVSDEQLAQLREFQAETRFRDSPGQGLGLLAVQRYASSIGGWISLASKMGEFFEVKLLVDEYREDIHGPYSTIGEGKISGTGRR